MRCFLSEEYYEKYLANRIYGFQREYLHSFLWGGLWLFSIAVCSELYYFRYFNESSYLIAFARVLAIISFVQWIRMNPVFLFNDIPYPHVGCSEELQIKYAACKKLAYRFGLVSFVSVSFGGCYLYFFLY
jgi:hypothetical protein